MKRRSPPVWGQFGEIFQVRAPKHSIELRRRKDRIKKRIEYLLQQMNTGNLSPITYAMYENEYYQLTEEYRKIKKYIGQMDGGME